MEKGEEEEGEVMEGETGREKEMETRSYVGKNKERKKIEDVSMESEDGKKEVEREK